MDKKWFEDRIGTKGTETSPTKMPNVTIEGLVPTWSYARVGIGNGRFVVVAGRFDAELIEQFRKFGTSAPKKTVVNKPMEDHA